MLSYIVQTILLKISLINHSMIFSKKMHVKKTIKDNVYWESRCVEFGLNTNHIENQKYSFINLMKNQIQV